MNRAFLLLAPLLFAVPALAQSAKELNAEGFRLYQAGKFPEALEKFQAASQADPKYALAWYNSAATLGVLRKQDRVCEFEAYRETIVQQLGTAVKLDPRRLTRAKEDKDFEPIRDTLGWQRLLGRSPQRVADVPTLLRQVSWFGPGVGVYGTTQKLRFQEGGRVVLWRKTVDDAGTPREEELPGTYTVKGRAVELRFPGMKQPLKGTLTATGALKVNGLETFTDSPSECEA
jgi:tetratricopeptide (TPR) repeat protein